MILSRIIAVMALVTLVAVLMVHVRNETARATHRAHAAQLEAVRERRALWRLQMRLAELRTPQQIRERVEALNLSVGPNRIDPLSERADLDFGIPMDGFGRHRADDPLTIPLGPTDRPGETSVIY